MGSETAGAASLTRPRSKLSPDPGMVARDVAAHQLARIHSATVDIVAELALLDPRLPRPAPTIGGVATVAVIQDERRA